MKQACGCCAGIELVTPEAEYNRPGLSALTYRVGTYGTFVESMLARLSTVYVEVPPAGRIYPLKALTTRDVSDPSIAVLDAWAVVADVLTFYQERIANEGFLPTATERVSLIELARLIGYKPRPGVAASVFLAFTTASGFRGEIPAGTRAQSVPGTGETAQFFETSVKFDARDTWNSLGLRLTRPLVVAPPPDPKFGFNNHLGTNADIIDSLYFEGIATNLKPGDPLLLVLSDSANEQFLRWAARVNPQSDFGRTQVVLREPQPANDLIDVLLRFVEDAPEQFPGSDQAASVAASLQAVLDNISSAPDIAAAKARAALQQVQSAHDVTVRRQFWRVEAWLQHLLDILPAIVQFLEQEAIRSESPAVAARTSLTQSGLQRLGALLPAISLEKSAPPVNPLRLQRSVRASFAHSADTLPRLLQSLNPVAAPLLYKAWGNIQPVHFDLEIYALRAKAALFASTFAGASTISRSDTKTTVSFTAASIANTWMDVLPSNASAMDVIALDAVYDKITANSWIVVDQPVLNTNGVATGERTLSYHQVEDVKTQSLDTTNGFTAKVTLLKLRTPWIVSDSANTFTALIGHPLLLRSTVVYGQAETLKLTEAPLDRDVEGSAIELDGLYDGLEPGRWIIVSGERTDIPNVAGVKASELAMISAVTQGAGKDECFPFPPAFVPFESLFYVSDENSGGDRLIVGVPANGLLNLLGQIPLPSSGRQEFCDAIELVPGLYANAYVPTAAERGGDFADFADVLFDPVDPASRFHGGVIPVNRLDRVFAWRIRTLASASEGVHTTVQFANPLAYKYNTTGIQIYANVAKATHGQTTGEVLGSGDGSIAFQEFSLHQKPLTYVSAPTAQGAESTLAVRVNELEWHEGRDLSALASHQRGYVTESDDADVTSVSFGNDEHGARVPTGSSNIKATYRYGIGSAGNVDAGQISQLATHPLGLQGVVNPLPATGGADRDSADQIRRNAPLAVTALDRLVSVEDYVNFVRSYAGIGKAAAVKISDGRRQLVHITIVGVDDIPIDNTSDLCQNLLLSLLKYGDPLLGVQVCTRRLKLLVVSAGIALEPDYLWEAVEPQVRSAVLAGFSFDSRDLGQTAFQSEAIALMQGVEGVQYVDMRVFDGVGDDVTVETLATLASTLKLKPYITADVARLNPFAAMDSDPCTRVKPAELVYLTPNIPDTLILTEIGV